MADHVWKSTSSTSFGTAGNWSDGNAPANSDRLRVSSAGTASIITDLTTSLTGATLVVEPGASASIGTVVGGVATPLTLAGGTLLMPRAVGGTLNLSGSPRVLLAFGSSAATVDIETSNPTGTESEYPTVQITGLDITARIGGGSVGFGVRQDQSATLTACRVSQGESRPPTVFLGLTVAVTELIVAGGTVYSYSDSAATTVRVTGGRYVVMGAAAHTNLYVDGGEVEYLGSGTITNLYNRAGFNASKNVKGFTITNPYADDGSVTNLDNGKPGLIVCTNAIQLPGGLRPGMLALANGMKLTLAMI